MMTKQKIFLISGIITISFFVLDKIGTYQLCGRYAIGNCPFLIHDILGTIIIFLPVFLISIIVYKMRDEVYRSWIKFTQIWVPLTILLIIISPEYGNSLLPIEKGSVSFFMSLLFLVISLVIIITKSVSLRQK